MTFGRRHRMNQITGTYLVGSGEYFEDLYHEECHEKQFNFYPKQTPKKK